MTKDEIMAAYSANPEQLFTFPNAPNIIFRSPKYISMGIRFTLHETVELYDHMTELGRGFDSTKRDEGDVWIVYPHVSDLLYTLDDIILFTENTAFAGLEGII